jgi:hypothetical protein
MTLNICRVAAFLFVCTAFVGSAQASDLKCTNPVRLNGETKTGNDFQRAVGNGLVFALKATRTAPPNPLGWTMSIYVPAAPRGDLLSPANPRLGGLWVGNLTLSFGQTADRIVSQKTRTFFFYTDRESSAQSRANGRTIPDAPPGPQGQGEFVIDSYEFGTSGSTKIIAKLKFHVALCLTTPE